MPDHPSWPAELVEKAAKVIYDLRTGVRGAMLPDPNDGDFEMAEAVLAALSGDLVPREERPGYSFSGTVRPGETPEQWHERQVLSRPDVRAAMDAALDEVEVPWSLPSSDSPAIELVPRSQADALAEALEDIIGRHGDHYPVGSWRLPGHEIIAAEWEAARSALASYHSSSTETGE